MTVLSVNDVGEYVAGLHAQGKRIVFTNGVFDLLHPGHVRYLQAARNEGDVLIIGVNSDRSVRANKGPSRPIAGAYILLSLAAVMRVFAPPLVADAYWWTVIAAGLLWICAFGIFIVVYTPILWRRRIDGRPG